MAGQSLAERVVGVVNRVGSGPERPLSAPPSMRPPAGRWFNWAHYGVMVPNLPEPHRYFGIMAIVGTPEVTVFANDHVVATTPRDTTTVVSSTAAMTHRQFLHYSTARDCAFADDGSRLRFGDDIAIDGRYPTFTVARHHPEVGVELSLRATGTITRFFDIPGLYRHWSLLCEYDGVVGETSVSGLCALEYACGAGPHSLLPPSIATRAKLPAQVFTYQIVNVDDRTQVLLTHVSGPFGTPVIRTAYVRTVDGGSHGYTTGCTFTVDRVADQRLRTPDGRTMTVPDRYRWRLVDEAGSEVLFLECEAAGDWAYGLGAGFVGSFRYTGQFGGDAIEGVGYAEYVDAS
ncbi:DUF6670 family protein [Prescottella agglutinans]|uniref:Uncharacterized protein n=1 Tax=Prescottella agglutinans TaxID=1644129 RepID=A0ABT6MGI9_9NOCA|nr:DUF6670 family protein [Prescottella agglutinans]MDH6282489.1 hypothetical protein [Prescottella agglutinans]